MRIMSAVAAAATGMVDRTVLVSYSDARRVGGG
jgi:hypothetical protein